MTELHFSIRYSKRNDKNWTSVALGQSFYFSSWGLKITTHKYLSTLDLNHRTDRHTRQSLSNLSVRIGTLNVKRVLHLGKEQPSREYHKKRLCFMVRLISDMTKTSFEDLPQKIHISCPVLTSAQRHSILLCSTCCWHIIQQRTQIETQSRGNIWINLIIVRVEIQRWLLTDGALQGNIRCGRSVSSQTSR